MYYLTLLIFLIRSFMLSRGDENLSTLFGLYQMRDKRKGCFAVANYSSTAGAGRHTVKEAYRQTNGQQRRTLKALIESISYNAVIRLARAPKHISPLYSLSGRSKPRISIV